MMHRPVAAAALLALPLGSCEKVPIYDVDAGFALADASWFEEEETLFLFYEVSAEQGIGDPSVIEITYATDDARVDWTVVEDLPTVHTHLSVDCGLDTLCGSTSLHVPGEPREVGIRLRYHHEGELALEANTVFNIVNEGAAHLNRSLLVYGVFDETNQRVQWRSRHRFPTLRNMQVEDYGLRRAFTITSQTYGDGELTNNNNPYGYGASCPSGFTDGEQELIKTVERAMFNTADLPLDASDDPVVCAQSTVTDATGTFTAGAVALKNPQVAPAFPTLRSPVNEATPIKFFLAPCNEDISPEHEEMQRQRLQMEWVETTCIDDWGTDTFVDRISELFTDAIEARRIEGNDMVLVVGLHRDSSRVAEKVEEALLTVVPEERHQASPRLAGAFVFDSDGRGLSQDDLYTSTLWCPSTISSNNLASLTCAILPDDLNFKLGPFAFGTLPVLPSRDEYLTFIDTYSESQAGEVYTISYLTPEFTPTSEHFDVGEFGVVSYFNDEVITADADDAFSYCAGDQTYYFTFRSGLMQTPIFEDLSAEKCEAYGFDPDVCELLVQGLVPIEYLPEWHSQLGETYYNLGIFWDFPFLLRMEYEAVTAASATVFGLTVPFGLGTDGEAYHGSQMWQADAFSLEETLTQCRRFCTHPTFDSAGAYNVADPFDTTYPSTCYLPLYPKLGDSGFPLDY